MCQDVPVCLYNMVQPLIMLRVPDTFVQLAAYSRVVFRFTYSHEAVHSSHYAYNHLCTVFHDYVSVSFLSPQKLAIPSLNRESCILKFTSVTFSVCNSVAHVDHFVSVTKDNVLLYKCIHDTSMPGFDAYTVVVVTSTLQC